jgi:hypothetical protein
MAAKKKKVAAAKVFHVKYFTKAQKAESALNKLRMKFQMEEHKLLMRRNELYALEARKKDSVTRTRDLKALRSKTLPLASEAARRLWESWVVPQFMPENNTQLRRAVERVSEFAVCVVTDDD